ncbi:MAG: cell surface protein [Proteobacteria bacterium]|nr:cell surface protein [Pseudomonadota bacterium]
MKRTLVAQCAAAVLTGAAFVGANAAVVGPAGAPAIDNVTAADLLYANKEGIGHIVVVPYYTAASGNDTYLSITNTDMRNGKAVKVRFRGASNSDDVFDFTLLMSPGDVWTGTVTKDATSGKAKLLTKDKSCTIPNAIDGSTFVTGRLASYQSVDAQAKETLEGYVEILNMADIYPGDVPAIGDAFTARLLPATADINPLYDSIKHSAGVPKNCAESNPAIAALATVPVSRNTAPAGTAAVQMGLDVPTGGLTATWTIINVPLATSYAGLGDAVEAYDTAVSMPAYGNIVFSPQLSTPVPYAEAQTMTADPLLRGAVADSESVVAPALRGVPQLPTTASSYVAAALYDFPDLSTPYLNGDLGALAAGVATKRQASRLTDAYAVSSVMNEFVSDAGLLAKTDWVFSSASRRYNVARNYGTSAATATTVFTDLEFSDTNASVGGASNRYAKANTTAEGNLICVTGVGTAAGLTSPVPNNRKTAVNADREETFVGSTSQFVISPGTPTAPLTICGEVSVLTFNNASGGGALGAQLTKKDLTGTNVNGWARLSTPGLAGTAPGPVAPQLGLPIVGGSFMQLTNGQVAAGVSGNYGITFPHRTTRF